MLSPEAYLKLVKGIYEANANEETAEWQRKYLRFKFDFYGMKAPVWVGLMKPVFKENGLLSGEALKQFVRLCYNESFRELHYTGLQMIEKNLKNQSADFIYFLEELIETNSWWDTVDWIAKLVRLHFIRHPELIVPVTEKWIESKDMWLQRVAIIFQLLLKDKTNEKLLYDYILRVKDSKEFFIQKAAGWALRDYSKTNPDSVRKFITANTLAPLTVREGSKYI